uniref:Replication initiation protein n=4 Tax=Paenibacillus popilliae ATCC 14706 TaxID=1212764 RepID=A0A0D6CB50_PAEPP|nr:replication initiation protein [Paenibacillus popilliae]BAQ95616.1 replication initiation protein [Paenibacillus popilliae ATCC 14706]
MPQNYSKPKGSRRGQKQFKPDPEKFLYNVDTLWYTFDALNYDAVMQQGLLDKLQTGKMLAEEGSYMDYVQMDLERYDYPVTFEIQASGQAPVYAFSIRNHDMAFYFARRRRDDGTYPIKVQINQFKLWEMGMHDAYQESLYVLAELGFECEATKPNRIDLCVHSDQWDWRFSDFKVFSWPMNFKRDNQPDFVRLDPHTDGFGTVYFGDRSRCQLRIYNKSKEIKDKRKDYFLDLYERRGMDVDRVWNVEFEIRRDYMRDFANMATGETRVFDSMDYLLRYDGLSMLWTYLVTRFVHDSAFWRVLQQGDPDKFVQCKNYLFRLRDIDTEKRREVAQIRGRLQKLVLNEELPPDADMMIEAMKKFVMMCEDYEDETERDFPEEVRKKRKRYMDIQMLKLLLSEKRKTTDDMNVLHTMQAEREALKIMRAREVRYMGEEKELMDKNKIKTPARQGSQNECGNIDE